MIVRLKISSITSEIGSEAFFSTIHCNLDTRMWEERSPIIMYHLYQGEILKGDAEQALRELRQITTEFSLLSPDKTVRDFEDSKACPP